MLSSFLHLCDPKPLNSSIYRSLSKRHMLTPLHVCVLWSFDPHTLLICSPPVHFNLWFLVLPPFPSPCSPIQLSCHLASLRSTSPRTSWLLQPCPLILLLSCFWFLSSSSILFHLDPSWPLTSFSSGLSFLLWHGFSSLAEEREVKRKEGKNEEEIKEGNWWKLEGRGKEVKKWGY